VAAWWPGGDSTRHYCRFVAFSIVVGGSEGIGLAVAAQLAHRGDDVVICSRSRAKLDVALDALAEQRRRDDQRLEARQIDVTDPHGTRETVDALVAEFGPPDLVVNTAGYARPGWLSDLPAEDVQGMVDVNLRGTIHVARAVIPHLVEAGLGRFVATSSMAGLAGVFGYTVYSATKFGVLGFAEALRREVAPAGVGVHVLCPPNTLTPGFETENRFKPAEVLAAEEKAQTMTADEVATELLRALGRSRPKPVIVPGRGNRLSAFAIRHLPFVVDRALRRPTP